MEKRDRRAFTKEELLEHIRYDPETGALSWNRPSQSPKGIRAAGASAGTWKDGYVSVILFGRAYRAHHLAWLIMTGGWPPVGCDIDHIDRDRSNNKWSNLRIATRSQNIINSSVRKDNSCGHTGVHYRKDNGKWAARISFNGKINLLGQFDTFEEAVAARVAAERRLYGEFAS